MHWTHLPKKGGWSKEVVVVVVGVKGLGWGWGQSGKAKEQNNITKAAKIDTVFKPYMNKVASLLIDRKVAFQQLLNKWQGCITIGLVKSNKYQKYGTGKFMGKNHCC